MAEPATTPMPAPQQQDRRRVSVLFIDLIDSTPYVEREDPEMVREMQNNFFTAARQVIGRYGGVVEKYIGDAVMALFGAPVATETDALRCVRAGLDLQRVLDRYGAAEHGSLRFRVGVSTGEALVDVTAARDGGQAIVSGDVVNTASRLQSVAPPGGVLVCGATYATTKSMVRYAEQPRVTLKGRSSPTEVWLALAPVHSANPPREIEPTPLVNRTHEIKLLVNAMNRALRENVPQLVTMLGQAGIGKSRLTRELYQHCSRMLDTPVRWRTGRCPPFGENVTYAALAQIVKAEAGIRDTDDAATARQHLELMLHDVVGPQEAPRLTEALGPLVGLAGSKLAAEDAESSWRRFLVALAANGPTVLVFEDLHWADDSMVRFVELLSASIRDVPMLLLCTARPDMVERHPTWAVGSSGSLTVTVGSLRRTEITTMYAHLLGQAAFGEEMLGPLVELADGNPLYAHEYTRMLVEQGAVRAQQLTGEAPDTPSLPTQSPLVAHLPLPNLPMPDSVHAVIANRVDLLDPRDRSVLQAAAVVGMQFWSGAVAAALGQPTDLVERALRRLEQRDLVREQPTSAMDGEREYRFGHVLVRDVCYQRLPRTERVARHERTANWLDGVAGSQLNDLAEVLAHHRFTAYEIARTLGHSPARFATPAVDALHRAARRAYALRALDVAAGHTARALGLCTEDAATDRRLPLELLATEITFYQDGDKFLTDGGPERLTTLAGQLEAVGAASAAARAYTLLGQAAWLRADRPSALGHLERAVALFVRLPDSPEKVDAYGELGRLRMLNYERAAAVAGATTAADIATRLGLVEAQAHARVTVGAAQYQAGERAGLAELQDILELCRSQQLLTRRRALQNVAYALREEGDVGTSDRLLAEGATEVPGGHNLTTGFSQEAMLAYNDGDFDRMAAATEAMLASPSAEWDLAARAVLPWVRVLRDESPDRADADEVEEILSVGARSGFHRLNWTALAHAALCRALQGRSDEACALLTQLAKDWRSVEALASYEWVGATAHAAVLCGHAGSAVVRDMLVDSRHRTLWVRAALHTVTGGIAEANGDHERAGQMYMAATELYTQIPDRTDRILSLASAVRAWRFGDASAQRTAAEEELARFASLSRAPGLLRLAGMA